MSGSRRIGRGALKKILDADDISEQPDNRAAALTEQITVDGAVIDLIRDVFEGTPVLTDSDKVARILAARSEIAENWGRARDAFLAIGRALLELENVLSKAEYLKLRSGTDRLFPFSDATATQFRQIARAVDSGRIPLEKCPGSYGTAYQITLLTDWQLQLAQQRGLIRPDVTRKEIASLRKEMRLFGGPAQRVDAAALKDERRRLVIREENLSSELSIVRARIKELDELLGPE